MPIEVILAAVAVAASIPLFIWALAGTPRTAAREASREALAGRATPDLRTADLQRSVGERAVQPTLGWLVGLGRRITPLGLIEALEYRITLAGRPPAWPIERVLIVKVLLGAIGFVLGFLLFADNRTLLWLLLWGAIVALGYFTPDLLLYSRGQERQEAITKELPDTLDQMTISVEAGLGFESAMARAARSGEGPLAQELTRTLQEIQVGVPRSRAMRDLSERTTSEDLRHFVLAVIQAEKYGIPIADVLRTQAQEQRTKRRQRAEEHAMKIPVKIVFPVVLCILPTLFIVILGPAVIQITRMFAGM